VAEFSRGGMRRRIDTRMRDSTRLKATEDIVEQHLPTESERQVLWQTLERLAGARPATERRGSQRLGYSRVDIGVRITHPGGGGILRQVCARNLSCKGVCFLLPHFVHVGTACEVTLRRRLVGDQSVTGKAAWCRHIAGLYHGVGVAFASIINPKLFVESSEWERAQLLQHVAPEDLGGTLLILDDQEMDRALLMHLLKPTRIQVTAVSDLNQAMAAAAALHFDAAVIDLHLGTGKATGEEAIASLRANGFEGGVVAISADNNPARIAALHRAGLGLFVGKPYQSKELYAALGTALRTGRNQAVDPIYSELSGKEGYGELLERYVRCANQIADELDRMIAAEDIEEVRLRCWAIRGSGTGYGFRSISDLASEAIRALDAGGAVKEAVQELLRLQNECRRLSAGSPGE
jgi:CheY-like chemotaxis protein